MKTLEELRGMFKDSAGQAQPQTAPAPVQEQPAPAPAQEQPTEPAPASTSIEANEAPAPAPAPAPARQGGYENAPATRMLATHCACCGRPLVDAKSVETGMGPECRGKHGYNVQVSEDARKEANKLVHDIAVRQKGVDVVTACSRLRELGFGSLAERVLKRVKPVSVELVNGRIVLRTPYNQAAVADLRKIRGRKWDADEKANTFPESAKTGVWNHLKTFFPGEAVMGPKGCFKMPLDPNGKDIELLFERVKTITVTVDGDNLEVRAPYNKAAVEDARTIPGRHWDKDKKCNIYPVTQLKRVWEHLEDFYPGHIGTGPQGDFELGGGGK